MNSGKINPSKKRIFIIPLDHSFDDLKNLPKIGIQKFVNSVDSLGHDGYIFHSRYYCKTPIKTKKDFFITVGEQPENFKLPIKDLERLRGVDKVAIFFEVDSKEDKRPLKFYKRYVSELKRKGYTVMGMGFPSSKFRRPNYQYLADLAHDIGCDYFKTDFFKGVDRLDLKGMRLFIAGGEFLNTKMFEKLLENVQKVKGANLSFGRNIFEADNYKERINQVLRALRL